MRFLGRSEIPSFVSHLPIMIWLSSIRGVSMGVTQFAVMGRVWQRWLLVAFEPLHARRQLPRRKHATRELMD